MSRTIWVGSAVNLNTTVVASRSAISVASCDTSGEASGLKNLEPAKRKYCPVPFGVKPLPTPLSKPKPNPNPNPKPSFQNGKKHWPFPLDLLPIKADIEPLCPMRLTAVCCDYWDPHTGMGGMCSKCKTPHFSCSSQIKGLADRKRY